MLRRRLAASNRLHRMPRAMPAATFLRHCIMATKRVTIQDVARAARVHASTVSRALSIHARPLVTPAVADRVRAAADRLGYVPDPVAAGLRTRGGAQGVGGAATRAVVQSAVMILVLDAFWAMVWLLGRAR